MTASIAPLVLPASQIVRAQPAPLRGVKGATLSGEWKLTTDATGRAAASGEVARWVAQPGSHVEAGDSVVEISTGAASRPASGAEALQNKAEQEQVKVAQSQSTLSQKLSAAQTQLVVAQDRVAQAQQKITAARILVKRLVNGEKIPVADATSSRTSRNPSSPKPEVRLTREQTKAISAADTAQNLVGSAKTELDAANQALIKAQAQSAKADLALKKAEDDFKVEKTTSDVLQDARADVDDASSTLKEVQTRLAVAQRTYSTRQQQAKIAESAAQEAREAQTSPRPTPQYTPETIDDSGRYMTADQAATLVGSALRESKVATRQADRLHARVEEYQRQVRDSSNRAADASKDLQQAQQHVLDSVPRATFVSTRAPLSGTVTWISRLAREVGLGDSVFGISQGTQGYVRFEDKSGAWKKLHVGQTLDSVSSAPQLAPTDSATPLTMPASNIPSATTQPKSSGSVHDTSPSVLPTSAVFSLRINRISPPVREGEPALIDAARMDGSGPSNASSAGVEAELPVGALPPTLQIAQSSQARPVVLPISVVLPRNGASYVAVLTPTSQETPQQDTTVQEDEDIKMTLEWRPIEIHSHTISNVEVLSGIRKGEQLVDQPALLLAQSKPEERKSLLVEVEASS